MTDYPITGIDVSLYQGEMDWAKAAEKISFAYVRAGQGKNVDGQYQRNIAECARLGIPFGVYYVPKPDGDWRVQADYCKPLIAGSLPLVIDVELDGGLGKAALESWLFKFIQNLEFEASRRVMIYTAAWFWDAHFAATNWAKNRMLWVANYTTGAQPIMPQEWVGIANPRTWTLWQWSADHNGRGHEFGAKSDDIDLDRFNGDAAGFEATFGVKPLITPPPPVIPPSTPDHVRVIAKPYANIRATPGGADVGDLYPGSTLPVDGVLGDWYHVPDVWVHKSVVEAVK